MHLETKAILPLLALGLLGLSAQDIAAQKENHDRNHDPLKEAVKQYESRIGKLESLFDQLLRQRQKDRARVKMEKELAGKEQLLRDYESKIKDLSTRLQEYEGIWAKGRKSLQLAEQRVQQQDLQIKSIEKKLASLGHQLAAQQPQKKESATDLEKQLAKPGIHIHNAGGTIIIQVLGVEPEAEAGKR